MFCKNCGKEMRDDARFCPNCGAVNGGPSAGPVPPAVPKRARHAALRTQSAPDGANPSGADRTVRDASRTMGQ